MKAITTQDLYDLYPDIPKGSDRETAAVGNTAEKHIEIGDLILEAASKVAVTHGQFVKITQHCKISRDVFHFISLLPVIY